jgi:hypothetical protein
MEPAPDIGLYGGPAGPDLIVEAPWFRKPPYDERGQLKKVVHYLRGAFPLSMWMQGAVAPFAPPKSPKSGTAYETCCPPT